METKINKLKSNFKIEIKIKQCIFHLIRTFTAIHFKVKNRN